MKLFFLHFILCLTTFLLSQCSTIFLVHIPFGMMAFWFVPNPATKDVTLVCFANQVDAPHAPSNSNHQFQVFSSFLQFSAFFVNLLYQYGEEPFEMFESIVHFITYSFWYKINVLHPPSSVLTPFFVVYHVQLLQPRSTRTSQSSELLGLNVPVDGITQKRPFTVLRSA